MGIKSHRRRNRICQILRMVAAETIWIGIIGAVGISLKILVGMSPVQDAKWILEDLLVIAIGYMIGRTVRYIERRRMILDKMQRKPDKK